MVNPGNAISAQGLGDCTAEARRARSKEFLIKKYSELCELCTTIVEDFLRLRKFFLTTKRTKVTKDSDQFRYKTFLKLRDLRDLRGKNRLFFLAAALPRWASVVNPSS